MENLLECELEIKSLRSRMELLEWKLQEARAGNENKESFVITQVMANSDPGEKATGTNDKKQQAESIKKPEEWMVKKLVRGLVPHVNRHEFVIAAQTRMLMKLYEHREYGIEPGLLFGYTGVKKKTGYRYVSLMKEKKYLCFIGARQKGKYIMTDLGRRVMEGLGAP